MENFFVKDNYPVDVLSNVPPELRNSSAFTRMPPPKINGGLYGGKQSDKPWMPKPVVPTATNYHKNFKSANPPPKATQQYVGNIRLGNNYTAMPGVNWYVPKKTNCGPYNIQVSDL